MWSSEAPSNIALIKYMGKMQNSRTLVEPYNISLSYTLHRFFTKVSLENCLSGDQFISEINFNKKAVDRFLLHVKHIKSFFNYKGFFLVRSSNNFPHSAGIASSSSSFAALTKCVVTALCDISCVPLLSLEQMSKISRMSSGSSCRSFFSPWSVWDSSGASSLKLKINELDHDLILIDQVPKKVSSSEAHNLVKSSPLFESRFFRAQQRFENLVDALNGDRWSDARRICWEEFLDMHQLFETSTPSFGYIQPRTTAVLDKIRQFCETNNDGPIVTIDAGPNIHLLWKKEQGEMRKELKKIITQMFCEII
jgi:diphosphomevalonate decarboxylase